MTRDEIFDKLAELGITSVEVPFSGGNDEGYAERPIAKPDGNTGLATVDDEFIEALEAPIYDEYGSFAGDFSVYGTLVWRVATRTVRMMGEERSDYDYFEKDL